MPDTIHPNAAGMELLAMELEPLIAQAVARCVLLFKPLIPLTDNWSFVGTHTGQLNIDQNEQKLRQHDTLEAIPSDPQS